MKLVAAGVCALLVSGAVRAQLEYGFRYDPTNWLTTSTDLDAVRLRTLVLQDPLPGDRDILEAEIAKVLADQQPDGHLGAPNVKNPIAETGDRLWRLLELGCAADRPELQAAAARVCQDLADADPEDIGFHTLSALCRAGLHDDPVVRRLVLAQREWLMSYDADNAFGPGVARTPNVKLMRLWYCREVGGLDEAIGHWLKWIEDRLEPTICGRDVGLFLLWDAFQIVGEVEHPVTARLAPRLVPVLLRMQQPDGTWGGRFSYRVYRFLIEHDLLEPLTKLPPLPPDWEVVWDIPVPCESPFSLGWDGELLWVQDKATHTAIAVSPEDGEVKRTILLPGSPDRAVLGIWGGELALAIAGGLNTLYQVDSVSGDILREVKFPPDDVLGVAELGGRVVIADHWDGHIWETPSDLPGQWTPWRSAAGMPNFLTSFGDELWISDGICPLLIKTNRAGDLLDWGEKPFGWGGIAYTGRELWALDRDTKRLCVIEKRRWDEASLRTRLQMRNRVAPVLLLGAVAASASAQNLLRNGSCEGSLLYWHNAEPERHRLVRGGAVAGEYSLRTDDGWVMSAPFVCEPGGAFTVSLSVKGERDGEVSVQLTPSAREVGHGAKRLWVAEARQKAPIRTEWRRVSSSGMADVKQAGFWPHPHYMVLIEG